MSFLFLNRQSEVKRAMQGLEKKNLELYGGGNKNTRIWQFIQSKVVAELTQVLRAQTKAWQCPKLGRYVWQ